MCVSLCVILCLVLLLPFVLGFCLSAHFFSFCFVLFFVCMRVHVCVSLYVSFFFFLFFHAMWLAGSCNSRQASGLHLRWESRIQDTGPPENSQPQGILIGESCPRGLHLNTKTWFHPTASKLQCWMPRAKQLARQEHKPTH